jgi:hypothetical protein
MGQFRSLLQAQMLRHGNDICARYLLIPGKALQQENAAVQVDTDVYGFPTRSIHMGALKAEMSSTVQPAQQPKAEHNRLRDRRFEIA